MSDKAKKQASELSFSLSRWFRRVSTMKPSNLLFTIVIMAGSILLLGGIVYDFVNRPLPAVYINNRFYFLYPQLSEQFLFDTVVSGILYVAGFIGLLAIYQSARHAYNPRQAYMTMIVGATLLLISYIFLEYFIRLKASGA
jgi:undecaprenyl pyrophosphate phosphatase UppP